MRPLLTRPSRRSVLAAALAAIPAGGLLAGCGRDDQPPAVRVAASVFPLADLARRVAANAAVVSGYAQRGRRVGDFGHRAAGVPGSQPPPAARDAFAVADLAFLEGQSDLWALAGRSDNLPVVRLDFLPAARDHTAGRSPVVAGGLWTCPLVLADAADAFARELGLLRPRRVDTLRNAAAVVADRLRNLAGGYRQAVADAKRSAPDAASSPVVVVEPEPLALLRTLNVPAVLVPPGETPVPEPADVRRVADAAGASRLLLPAPLGEWTGSAWARDARLRVGIYDPLGAEGRDDGRSDVFAWAEFNCRAVAALAGPAVSHGLYR